MEYRGLELELLEFNEGESEYRKLYFFNPTAYRDPVRDWDEFSARYRSSFSGDVSIPDKAPSIMGENFVEQEFFPNESQEVAVIKNARYCPAFLHHLEFIKIIYVLRGSCILYVDNKILKMEQGSFCIILPNIEQSVFSNKDEDIVLNIIMRRSTFSNAFYSLLTEQGIISDFFWQMLYSKNNDKIMIFSNRDSEQVLEHTVLDLYKEALYEKNPSNLLLKSFVLIFFGYALRSHKGEVIAIDNTKAIQCHLPAIVRYMKDNMNQVTLVTLSEHFHMSEGYLSRYIRMETGYTFSYLLRDIRMKQSKELLRHSKYCIEEIIETVGYSDVSHFYRTFKALYGMTPAMYRNREDILII